MSIDASRPSPTRIRPTPLRKLRDESVVHGFMHVEAGGADAQLAGVAELGSDRQFDHAVDVNVVHHDDRRVSAEFQGDLLNACASLCRQLLPHRHRAREGTLRMWGEAIRREETSAGTP
jgi:hypothetical protein